MTTTFGAKGDTSPAAGMRSDFDCVTILASLISPVLPAGLKAYCQVQSFKPHLCSPQYPDRTEQEYWQSH